MGRQNWEQVLAASDQFTASVFADCAAGRFAAFDASNARSGWPLVTIEEVIAYHTIHEGIHLGIMMAMRKMA